jgi:lipopolysaccharide transport system ATP-binding protein
MSTVISVEHVSKAYRLGMIGGGTLKEDFARWWAWLRRKPDPFLKIGQEHHTRHMGEQFLALDDVSFQVREGEVLGIIGRNGAGKSTLLKILSQVTAPTSGEIKVRGRIASLLEVGTGFHPELTGRENIFLNGAILGMTKLEIRRKLDEIIAFSEIEEFIDTPVKRYSSGMYVRLAFAVAAHLEPEILVVDEVLAVGDAAFQERCLGKIEEVAKGGRTAIFVSHDMGAVTSLTNRAVLLQNGKVIASGASREIVTLYLNRSIDLRVAHAGGLEFFRRGNDTDSPVRITAVYLHSHPSKPDVIPSVRIGDDLTVSVDLETTKAIHGGNLTIILRNAEGIHAATILSWDKEYRLSLPVGAHRVSATISNIPLAPGHYFVDIGIDPSMNAKAYDVIIDLPLFSVVNEGQVVHWLERSWGVLHFQSVAWNHVSFRG